MKFSIELIKQELEAQIDDFHVDSIDFDRLKQLLKYSAKAMVRMDKEVEHYQFKSVDEQINFFKILRPDILSKYYYYQYILHLETSKLSGSFKQKKHFLKKELANIDRFFDLNKSIWRYYRLGSDYNDQHYFTQDYDIEKLDLAFGFIGCCGSLSKNASDTIAKCIAYQDVATYIDYSLENLSNDLLLNRSNHEELTFNGSKVDIVELAYALHHSNVCTDSIKAIIQALEQLFNIKIENYTRVYQDIKDRKKIRSAFLTKLANTIESHTQE